MGWGAREAEGRERERAIKVGKSSSAGLKVQTAERWLADARSLWEEKQGRKTEQEAPRGRT